MNIFKNLKIGLGEIVKKIAYESNVCIGCEHIERFTVEPCKDKNHGDVSTNVAMVLCKVFGANPRELAQKIIIELWGREDIVSAQIAGPGFVNIVFSGEVWQGFLSDVLLQKEYSLEKTANKELINIEYASPNPTGPMHIGHARGAVYGDVLANLLQKTGHNITREYYINDAGSQIVTLVKSAYIRYLESLGQEINISEGLYPGEYLRPVGDALKEQFGKSLQDKSEGEYMPLIRDFVVDEMMKIIIGDLAELGIKHDTLFSEKKQLHQTNKINQAIEILQNKDLIYQGVVEAPKNIDNIADDYEEREQTLFRSTLFNDDVDRVVKKSNGELTYLAGDIAYCLSKFERGATKLILPLGYDHAGYVKRLSAVCSAITDNKASVKVILCQMVKFIKNGQQLKMSKRAGNFITLREVLDEIGSDALRFTMLTRKNNAPFDFDLAKVLEQSKDNPIFYVQYAFARGSSVLRNLEKRNLDLYKEIKGNIDINYSNLQDESELELIKKLANYPRIIEMAVSNLEPHRIAFYLQELAALFHALWNKGMENSDLRFIIDQDNSLTKSRCCLIIAMNKIIESALSVFNIDPLKEMR